MTATKEQDNAKNQAYAQLKSIISMVKALEKAFKTGDAETEQTAILEDILSLEVREGWHIPGDKGNPEEYSLLLCTGGLAVRVIGALDVNSYPHTAVIQYQDWGTPWTDLRPTAEQEQYVLKYSSQFYYGE